MPRQAVKQLSRDERQAVCIEKWKANNGHGTIIGATGFGFEIEAVSLEKSEELSLAKIGETPVKDNTEVSIETKEPIPPYSIGTEPLEE